MRNVCGTRAFLAFCMVLGAWSSATAQEIHVLPVELQEFAIKNGLYKALGTPEKTELYVNTLTAIEVIARTRAQVAGRGTKVSIDDYGAAGWIVCLLPWPPPKAQPDIDRMRKVLPKLVADAFVSEERRQSIVKRLNLDRLKLSAKEIADRKLSPLGILSIGGLE